MKKLIFITLLALCPLALTAMKRSREESYEQNEINGPKRAFVTSIQQEIDRAKAGNIVEAERNLLSLHQFATDETEKATVLHVLQQLHYATSQRLAAPTREIAQAEKHSSPPRRTGGNLAKAASMRQQALLYKARADQLKNPDVEMGE